MAKGWGPWLGMYNETVHYHKMGNKVAFLTLAASAALAVFATVLLFNQGWLQDTSRLITFIVVDLILAGAAVYVLVRILSGHSDIPFDPSTHPSQRHPRLYSNEEPKNLDYFCPNCFHQSNRQGKCTKCRGGRMKKAERE